jgi:type IV secretory pathway VirB10-like protein
MADHEYVYLQLSSRVDGALLRFNVQGQGDQVVAPPPPPPPPPGTPPPPPGDPLTPPGVPPPPPVKKNKSNLAMTIGIVVGVLGLLAVIGFLVYYIMKQKRLMAERLAEENDEDEDEEDEDKVQSFKSAKRGPASKKRNMR